MAIGCVTTIIGLFSGGMIGVFVGYIVSKLTGCQPPEGLPACNWEYFWLPGLVLGAISLPILTIRRIRRAERGIRSEPSL